MKNYLKHLCLFYNEHRKKLVIMRNAILIVLISTFQIFASESYSQTTKLSLKLENTPIKEVLSAIEDQSEFYFLYNSELVDVSKKVDISLKGEKIEDVLALLFNKNEVDILIKDRYIVLTHVEGIVQQQKTITGKVTDESGESLPGVTVMVKGTATGTITNFDGIYSLTLPDEAEVLVFSYIGMKTWEVEIAGQTSIDVILQEDVTGIDEVIVVGYSVRKKSTITGAISTIAQD